MLLIFWGRNRLLVGQERSSWTTNMTFESMPNPYPKKLIRSTSGGRGAVSEPKLRW